MSAVRNRRRASPSKSQASDLIGAWPFPEPVPRSRSAHASSLDLPLIKTERESDHQPRRYFDGGADEVTWRQRLGGDRDAAVSEPDEGGPGPLRS